MTETIQNVMIPTETIAQRAPHRALCGARALSRLLGVIMGQNPLRDNVTETIQNVTIPAETIARLTDSWFAAILRRWQHIETLAESGGI